MKKIPILLCFLVLVFFGVWKVATRPHIRVLKREQYQDILVGDKVFRKATHGHHHNEERYAIIREFLSNFKRPFALFDLGASQGYYSLRAASEFDCTAIMLEGNNPHYPHIGEQLLDICRANKKLDTIIFLSESIYPERIELLSQCENVDVVLVLNILHWFQDEWKVLADATMALGRFVIFETPPVQPSISQEQAQLREDIYTYLMEKGAVVIGDVPRHLSNQTSQLLLVDSGEKSVLRKRSWVHQPMKDTTHVITSTFKEKTLSKIVDSPPDTRITETWHPGINLVTFKMMHGAYPETKTLLKGMEPLRKIKHTDWMINNMIVQGRKVLFIDFNDPHHAGPSATCYSKRRFAKHQFMVQMEDPEEFESYFWNDLVPNRK